MYNKMTTEIYFSDLSYECQEQLKENLLARLKDDPETMEDVAIKAQQAYVDDEIDFDLLTQEKKDWEKQKILDEMIDDIINREFYGEINIGEDY